MLFFCLQIGYMKTLFLVRHAKSSWEYDGVHDYDRPLKGSGIRDAHIVSQYLANRVDSPQKLISSAATRALHTAMIFARNLNYPFSKIEIHEELYLCSHKEMLSFVKTLDDSVDSAMVFCHNPTITNFVNKCIDQSIDNVPTTGVASFNFDISSWKDATFNARLALFEYPKKHKKE